MNLKNKTALVTGTTKGIGKEIVKRFAEEGANVFAHARNSNIEHETFCKNLENQYNVKIIPVYFDAIDFNQIKESINIIRKQSFTIDILVNNISKIKNKTIFQMANISDIRDEFEINYFSLLFITQYISRIMSKQKRGSIINISSVAGLDGNTGMIGYVSSKAAIIGATKRMAIELGEYNIRVNSIAPGLTDTEMGNMMGEDLQNTTLSHQIFNHKATTTDIANMAVFLGSDLSKHITGQIIRVDGGMLK